MHSVAARPRVDSISNDRGAFGSSVEVRVHQLVDAIQFFIMNEAVSAVVFEILFRDRFGRRHDQVDAKIKASQIFNLQSQRPSVRLSVNQWVPGSSPSRGAK